MSIGKTVYGPRMFEYGAGVLIGERHIIRFGRLLVYPRSASMVLYLVPMATPLAEMIGRWRRCSAKKPQAASVKVLLYRPGAPTFYASVWPTAPAVPDGRAGARLYFRYRDLGHMDSLGTMRIRVE